MKIQKIRTRVSEYFLSIKFSYPERQLVYLSRQCFSMGFGVVVMI